MGRFIAPLIGILVVILVLDQIHAGWLRLLVAFVAATTVGGRFASRFANPS
jgi:uncharacterized membrane protein YccC